jgi:hypothetical protein
MDDIFEQLHQEFIESEDYMKYLKELDISSEKFSIFVEN